MSIACVVWCLSWSLLLLVARAEDYVFITNNGTIMITGYGGPGGHVIVPETIHGLPVTDIAMAFGERNDVFRVTLPDSVLSIWSLAFSLCRNLTNVTLGNGITYIGDQAFWRCDHLPHIAIPRSVSQIESAAFSYCTNLEAIVVDDLNPAFLSEGGVLFDKSRSTLLCYPAGKTGSYIIPDGVTRVEYAAFQGCMSLTNVVMPTSLASVGEWAFERCFNLSHITFSQGLTRIGSGTFSECTGLSVVTLPDSVTEIVQWAFLSCSNLTHVVIGSNTTNFARWAFQHCSSLSAITVDALNPLYASVDGVVFDKSRANLRFCPEGKAGAYAAPDTVTNITDNAFRYCARLTQIHLGRDVGSIGGSAFSGCTDLTAISVDEQNPIYTSFEGVVFDKGQLTLLLCPEGRIGSYAIPNGTITIGSKAFRSCARLTDVVIPESVTSIRSNAFQYCAGMTSVTIPGSVGEIGRAAFHSCTGLTAVSLSEGLRTIGSEAFRNCAGLTSLTLPDSLTSLGAYAFQANSSLTNVTMGNGLSSLPEGVFFDCRNLVHVTLPTNLAAIGIGAFDSCQSLANITLPDSVSSIGLGAFNSCGSLTNVTIPEGVTTISWDTFRGCSSLVNVTIPSSVTSVGNGAFYGCSSLSGVTIPHSVTSIGSWVFADCGSLTGITVEALNPVYFSADGVLFDKSRTRLIQFPGGKGGSYTIPESVTTVETAAFYRNRNLAAVIIPIGISDIGSYAFAGCAGLTGVYFRGNGFDVYWSVFSEDDQTTVYYLPGKVGWGATCAGRPTALWLPAVRTSDGTFGVVSNGFGFTVAWASGQTVVVEACTELGNPLWLPLRTETLLEDTFYFGDPSWDAYPRQFYRLRSQ